ncbi:sterol desaturase family protein [Myxococcus sp. MISCRS1]|uniref:sterol desaturase family protein n=1 Tax=Myxococcus sp. MISCRS1 TaxID=2996786 RepID=UPI00226D82D3|nr:sterol desaturase family protein [Myxococcus sp. MISCRS1]MCY1000444.1 sterol desaturase family protein [Myxococcus sp. MISCRS1]
MSINVYAIATPFVIALALGEFIYCVAKRNGYYSFQDSIASVGTAVLNQCVNVAVALMVLPLFTLLGELSLWRIDSTSPWALVGLFLGVDFLFYWFHRFGHRTNIGWAAHSPHHSTEELNYAVALRASVTQRLFSFLFYWPLVVIGFSPEAVLAMVAFHLVLQFIPHTRVIPKLPRWIESWLNTPSHHRVHHARNDVYIDKNYAGFLIIWDKMFGTYREETEECSYGVTTPPNTWDPTVINFQFWAKLCSDAVKTRNWWDKLRLWVMPTGWRPADLPARVETKWNQTGVEVKFQSTELPNIRGYLVFQMIASMPFMLLVSHHASPLSGWQKLVLSVFFWGMATAWGGMMESKRWGLPLEMARVFAMGGAVTLWLVQANAPMSWRALTVGWLAVTLVWLSISRVSGRSASPVPGGASTS